MAVVADTQRLTHGVRRLGMVLVELSVRWKDGGKFWKTVKAKGVWRKRMGEGISAGIVSCHGLYIDKIVGIIRLMVTAPKQSQLDDFLL